MLIISPVFETQKILFDFYYTEESRQPKYRILIRVIMSQQFS